VGVEKYGDGVGIGDEPHEDRVWMGREWG